MGDVVNVVRMTISVPKELKAQMDGTTSVNWSAVASEAFRAKLLTLQSKKETTTMDEVAERLRAGDELDRNIDYRDGWAAGERWARQEARPKQLRNLQQSMEESAQDPGAGFETVAGHKPAGVGWHVYLGMLGRRGAVTSFVEVREIAVAADAFWNSVIGTDRNRIETASFGQGFVEGALSIWEQIKDQVDRR